MNGARARRAFTLLEMMLATSIFALVMGGICAFVVGGYRMVRGAYAEAELSLQLRQLREKLLFHVAPPHGGTVWAGLLSGSASRSDGRVVEDGVKVLMTAGGVNASTGYPAAQTIQLVQRTDGSARWFGNDGDRYGENAESGLSWLRPVAYTYLPDEADTFEADGQLKYNLFFVNLVGTMNGVTRRERLAVPIFGTAQVRDDSHVFHDGN